MINKPHGKKGRYMMGCRCTQCQAWAGHREIPAEVRWPFYFIRHHKDRLALWFDDEQLDQMRRDGLDDRMADEVAVRIFGRLPQEIWPGWLERGLDDDYAG